MAFVDWMAQRARAAWVCLAARLPACGDGIDSPVHTDDPVGRALDDVQLLTAFAAQSRRSVKPDKVEKLMTAAVAVFGLGLVLQAFAAKRAELAAAEAGRPGALDPPRQAGAESGYRSYAVWAALKRDLSRLEGEKRARQADNFRNIVVEVRLIAANISAYLSAMAMGLLGALTFILRTLTTQLRDHTYVPVSISISVVRIVLGAIAGVFGSMLASGNEVSKSLPPLFVPFIFGYGIEILFSLLDKTVRAFTQPESGTPRPT